MKALLVILIALSVGGCNSLITDIDPARLPTTKDLLVVHGYLSPQDTNILISVTRSTAVLGLFKNDITNEPTSLEGAKVWITNRNKTVEIPYDSRLVRYAISSRLMPIRAGEIYNLKVTLGDKTVESSCKIPANVPIYGIQRDSILANYKVIPATYNLSYRFSWDDIRGESNYYWTSGLSTQTRRVQTSSNAFLLIVETYTLPFGDIDGSWMTDEASDGVKMTSKPGIIPSRYNSQTDVMAGTRKVEFVLTSYEKTYYDYYQALQRFDGGNPFAEPSILPSNIKGGLGCFAGYNRSTFVSKW